MKIKDILVYILICSLSGIVFAIRDKINNVKSWDLVNFILMIITLVLFGSGIAMYNEIVRRKK